MNIVIVSSLSPIATARYLVRAMRRAGHQLLVLSDVASDDADVIVDGTPDLAHLCAGHGLQPDLVLFVEGGTMRLFPQGLERLDCPVAWYGIDTHTNYSGHARLARLFDVTFIAQKMFVAELTKDSGRVVYWLPLACPSELLPEMQAERPIDVAFVGSLNRKIYPERASLLDKLRDVVPSVEAGPASPAEMMQRYGKAKIVLNQSYRNDINMRYFEAMGAGAVLLTDPSRDNGADELFEQGRHYLLYQSVDELITTVQSLCKDPERVRVIGGAARKEVEKRHTYDHRAAELLEKCHGIRKSVRPEPLDYLSAFSVLGMQAPALRAAAAVLATARVGTRQGAINAPISAILRGWAGVLDAGGQVLKWLRR